MKFFLAFIFSLSFVAAIEYLHVPYGMDKVQIWEGDRQNGWRNPFIIEKPVIDSHIHIYGFENEPYLPSFWSQKYFVIDGVNYNSCSTGCFKKILSPQHDREQELIRKKKAAIKYWSESDWVRNRSANKILIIQESPVLDLINTSDCSYVSGDDWASCLPDMSWLKYTQRIDIDHPAFTREEVQE